jgi:cytochrome b pre-mRNA-processing protein 3
MLWSMGMTDGVDPSGGELFSRDKAPPPRGPWRRRVGVLGAIVLVSLGMWMWVHGSSGGALRAMSPAQQAALYQDAWADQRAKCLGDAGPVDTESRCRQRAEFLLLFPQCDEICRAELAPSLRDAVP